MASFGEVIAIMLSAFVTGGLARLAVPGPDPMPAWMTVSIGLLGSAVGFGVAASTNGHQPYLASIASFGTAVLAVVAYRKLVQKRPVVGTEALRFPRRGVGVEQYRARLNQAGVDPDRLLDRALESQKERERDSNPDDEEKKQP
ncbi:MAG: hypothetical protein QOF45_784 [Gaiellaceae bacterium]|jgi:uncharacterized membrane protein YeaQ/YmgE (transglycosylase-associated protein family)|nr:hypothetical protein [Gaiellaceae bacterium]